MARISTMTRLSTIAASLTLLLARSALADVDCSSDVNITSADDAKDLRESCTTLNGNLILAEDLAETINLDGLEVINGNVSHSSSCEDFYEPCVIPEAFNISSSTLREIDGSVSFWYFHGLQAINLPKLERLQGTLSLARLHNVTILDLTSLKRVGFIILETTRLETLLIDGLEGFLDRGWGDGGVEIWDAGQVESVDGFFKNPIDPTMREGLGLTTTINLNSNSVPNVRNITVGWTRLKSLTVSGNDISLTLGGSETESMHVESLNLGSGVHTLKRGSAMENLLVDTFTMTAQEDGFEVLTLPFDQLSHLDLGLNHGLKTIEMSELVEQWNDTAIYIRANNNLDLAEAQWYWPRSVTDLILSANLTSDFLYVGFHSIES